MITNMRNAVEQAACEVGRAMAKYEMLIGNSTMLPIIGEPRGVPVMPSGNGTRKRRVAYKAIAGTTKTAVTTKVPKAPVIARGVRKAAGPRTKGVKEAIVRHLRGYADGRTTAEIIAAFEFKEPSVRATLMKLKKEGHAIQNHEKHWLLTASAAQTGNSDITSEYA